MAGYYSSLFGQLTFKFFQTRMADFTLFVGIKKNSFKVFGDGRRFAPASRGYENFSLRYNFFKPGWPTSLCSSASLEL